jgi:uncharacterized RDD family membrane protein YckC
MSTPSGSWQAPDPDAGPAPGVQFASPGARLVGYIVDIFIQFMVVVVLGILSTILAVIFWPLAVVSALLIIVVSILYFPYFWVQSGQTPGMTLMKIKVVRDEDGLPITWGPAILRWIGFWVSTFVFYIGFIWIFIDKRRRGWMDLLAGTVVIAAPEPPYSS